QPLPRDLRSRRRAGHRPRPRRDRPPDRALPPQHDRAAPRDRRPPAEPCGRDPRRGLHRPRHPLLPRRRLPDRQRPRPPAGPPGRAVRGRRGVRFDTKIAVVLRDDLAVWQKTNVTAFLVSGIAGTVPEVVGEPYRDASGNEYLPMLVQP